jgi:hypothetical protein
VPRPYGRVAVVPYSASGKLLLDADSGRPPWRATLFGAAQDAAQGQFGRPSRAGGNAGMRAGAEPKDGGWRWLVG